MKMRLIGCALVAFLLAGCSFFGGDAGEGSRTYAYVAYDSTGAAAVRGTLTLDFEDAGPDSRSRFRIRGAWDLEQVEGAARIERKVGEGRLRGYVEEDGRARISLMPGWEDADAVLRGSFESEAMDRLQGAWAITDWGMTSNGGRFEAERR